MISDERLAEIEALDEFLRGDTDEAPLKTCPFCGGSAKLFLPHVADDGTFIECQSCRASSICVIGIKEDPRRYVIEAWNKRAEEKNV